MEESGVSSTSKEWVHDWDLLSPRFQSEMAAYLEVIAVLVAAVLIMTRARLFKRVASDAGAGAESPPERPDGAPTNEELDT